MPRAVQLQAVVVLIFCGAEALVGNAAGDPGMSVASAACHDGHRVNYERIRVEARRPVCAYQLLEQDPNSPRHAVQPVNKGLVRYYIGEPIPQVITGKCMDSLELRVALLAANEKVYGQNFLVREPWFGIIAVSLAVEKQGLFILLADVRVDLDEP